MCVGMCRHVCVTCIHMRMYTRIMMYVCIQGAHSCVHGVTIHSTTPHSLIHLQPHLFAVYACQLAVGLKISICGLHSVLSDFLTHKRRGKRRNLMHVMHKVLLKNLTHTVEVCSGEIRMLHIRTSTGMYTHVRTYVCRYMHV